MTTTYIQTEQGVIDAKHVQKPQNRLFRGAWQLNGTVIDVDMVKAREIWRDKIRAARKPVLEQLDADYMKALESCDTTAQATIAAQKQALRDATGDTGIDAATTPAELEAVQPTGLTIS